MRWMFGLVLIATAPAVAQSVPTPSQVASNAFVRQEQAAGELNRHDGFAGDRSGNDIPVATILRAGAWGRCVAAASPTLARAYVATKSADPALKPIFSGCLRRTGEFYGSNQPTIRRAALSDALAPPR